MKTNKVRFNNTVLRDGHQSMAATRMTTPQMLPAAPILDEMEFAGLETWGGATIDSCLRYLNENPFERLRTLKKVQKEGEEKSEIQVAVTRIYVNDAFAKAEWLAKQIFASLSEGEELRTQLMALKKLARNTPINTVVLRRKIADSVIPLARYHLTKM